MRGNLHLLINEGATVAECRDLAHRLAPWWTDNDVQREIRDRGKDPQLRSYLWAYHVGIDWFMNAYEAGGTVLAEVAREAYKRPLTPAQLHELWPGGPDFSAA